MPNSPSVPNGFEWSGGKIYYDLNYNADNPMVNIARDNQLTTIDGDQFSGLGDQFLVQLGAEGQFSGNTGLATLLLGNPSNSNFTLTEGVTAATLDGSIDVDYANSTLVQFLQSVDGDFTDAQVQFIEAFLEPGVDLATLQAELDQGLADFKQVLQPLP